MKKIGISNNKGGVGKIDNELQIKASRVKDPGKQSEILKKAADGEKTVTQIRQDSKKAAMKKAETLCLRRAPEGNRDEIETEGTFNEWTWMPKSERFTITVRFSRKEREQTKMELIKTALQSTLDYLMELREMPSDPDNLRQLPFRWIALKVGRSMDDEEEFE